jgi:hypothetical protein
MQKSDIVVIRVPSLYDYPEKPLLRPPVLETAPRKIDNSQDADLLRAATDLNNSSRRMLIVDIASAVAGKRFDLDSYIKKLNAPVFAIEIEEREEIPPALEIAAMVKQLHPDSKTVLFGRTAAALDKELLDFAQMDAVLLESMDGPACHQFIQAAGTGRYGKVLDLAWKEKRGKVRVNEFSHKAPAKTLRVSSFRGAAVNQTLKHRDSGANTVLAEVLGFPAVNIAASRKESLEITLADVLNGIPTALSYRDPEDIYDEIVELCRYTAFPVTIKGDILAPGGHFAEQLLSLLQHKPARNPLVFEFRSAVQPFFIQEMARSAPRFQLKIAPGSHDETLRRRAGREYSNAELESTISEALKAGTGGIEISFLAGLPGQTPESVFETAVYCESLLRLFDGDRRLSLSLAPFSSPASAGFGALAGCGFVPRFKDFEDYAAAMELPCWSDRLEYRTPEMSAPELAVTVYMTLARMVRLKAKYGQLTPVAAERAAAVYDRGMEMVKRIAKFENDASAEEVALLGPEIANINRLSESPRSPAGLPLLSRPHNMFAIGKALVETSRLRRRNPAG